MNYASGPGQGPNRYCTATLNKDASCRNRSSSSGASPLTRCLPLQEASARKQSHHARPQSPHLLRRLRHSSTFPARSGDITGLQSTVFHMVRDPEFFHDANIDAWPTPRLPRCRSASRQDRDHRHLPTGRQDVIPMHAGPGHGQQPAQTAHRRRLTLLRGVTAVDSAWKGRLHRTVSAGAGPALVTRFIGLEMAVAFADMWGLDVTVIELFDQILPGVTADAVHHGPPAHGGKGRGLPPGRTGQSRRYRGRR